LFFITDRDGNRIRITDAHDSDGFVLSEIPSVIILQTVCVPFTDGINPSVKLYNGVVIVESWDGWLAAVWEGRVGMGKKKKEKQKKRVSADGWVYNGFYRWNH
jgi:hypothetical protein